MREKEIEREQDTMDRPDSGQQVDSETKTAEGVYTGTEIQNQRREIEEIRDSAEEDYARVTDIKESSDGVVVTLNLLDGTTEEIELAGPEDARLSGNIRKLYYYLGLDRENKNTFQEELVPIKNGESGIELAIELEPPHSNRDTQSDEEGELSGILGRVQQYTNQLRFIQGVTSFTAFALLILSFLILSVIGTSGTAAVAAIVAQLLAASVLLIRSYL